MRLVKHMIKSHNIKIKFMTPESNQTNYDQWAAANVASGRGEFMVTDEGIHVFSDTELPSSLTVEELAALATNADSGIFLSFLRPKQD